MSLVFISQIRESTGARILFPNEKDEDKELITIVGRKEAADKAKSELEAAIKDIVRCTWHFITFIIAFDAFQRLFRYNTNYRSPMQFISRDNLDFIFRTWRRIWAWDKWVIDEKEFCNSRDLNERSGIGELKILIFFAILTF